MAGRVSSPTTGYCDHPAAIAVSRSPTGQPRPRHHAGQSRQRSLRPGQPAGSLSINAVSDSKKWEDPPAGAPHSGCSATGRGDDRASQQGLRQSARLGRSSRSCGGGMPPTTMPRASRKRIGPRHGCRHSHPEGRKICQIVRRSRASPLPAPRRPRRPSWPRVPRSRRRVGMSRTAASPTSA